MNEALKTELRRKTLEAIHDSAVDAIVTIDEHGTIETVNPSTESLFGFTPDELIGQNIKILMANPFHVEHDSYLRNYLKTGSRNIIGIGREVVAKKKDGSTFPVHLAVSEVQLEGRTIYAGFIRDLTDLKLLEEQQVMLGRIIEDSLNEVFTFDTESLRFIQVNRGARENLGYTLEELRQLTPLAIKPECTREEFENKILQPLLNQDVNKVNFNTIHQRKDGSIYDVDVHLQLSTYLMKPVFVAIILDVTERLRQERMIRQQQADIQAELERLVETRTSELHQAQADLVRSERFSTLGKVSGGIAHEIRNPLNAVKTSAYYLMNAKDLSPAKIKEHLQRIDRQVSMIDNVVTAISDVAKLPEVNLRPVAMRPLLREVVGSVSLPSNIKTVYEFPENLPEVLTDEHQIGIAFRNLFRNARDSMTAGGTMTIRADVEDDCVVFSVIDSGVGISEQILDNVVEPLFTTKARGMGLGLSITLAIVEKNEGSLSIESKLGKGSKFSVALGRSD